MEEERAVSPGLKLLEDELGEAARVEVDLGIFDRTALFKTAYWGTEKAYLYLNLVDDKPNSIFVEIRPKSLGAGNVEQLARKFCNSLVDFQTRQLVLGETIGVRDALLKKAFAEGRRHLDPATLA